MPNKTTKSLIDEFNMSKYCHNFNDDNDNMYLSHNVHSCATIHYSMIIILLYYHIVLINERSFSY